MTAVTETQLWFIMRSLLALLVSIHGWHRIVDDGVLPFAQYMENRLPLGFYLVFVLQAMEMFGSLVFVSGRCVSVFGLIFAVIYGCSIYFYHRQFGWFQHGGTQNGAEYAFALVICFLATALAHWPRFDFQTTGKYSSVWGAQWRGAAISASTSKLAWNCLAYLIALWVVMHVGARLFDGGTYSMSALMPAYVLFPGQMALIATVLQAGACLAILVKRYQAKAFLVLAFLFLMAVVFHHARFGWIVSGADKDGAEYSFMLMLVSLCLAQHYRLRA